MKRLAKKFSKRDLDDLQEAREFLENPGIAAQIANIIGTPIEVILSKKLPKSITKQIKNVTQGALNGALSTALFTFKSSNVARTAKTTSHKLAVAVTGAVGGVFGFPGLAVELPLTTTIMLRSIADIARSEGEDLSDPSVVLACLEVFAMGGKSRRDDAAESAYFAVRTVIAQQVAAAAEYIAAHGISSKGAPAVVALIANISARFSVTVSEKVASQAVPIVGALTGAALNTLFISHFQTVARGHFIVRRLERRYGAAAVRERYERFCNEDR